MSRTFDEFMKDKDAMDELTEADYELLHNTSYVSVDPEPDRKYRGKPHYGSNNHISVAVDSPEYEIATKLVRMKMLKCAGSESKTHIKRAKLDPNKTWMSFYIGYSAGSTALKLYRERTGKTEFR